MIYERVEKRNYESADIKFQRNIRMLFLAMELNRPIDSIYSHAKHLARRALDYLDMRDYLKNEFLGNQ